MSADMPPGAHVFFRGRAVREPLRLISRPAAAPLRGRPELPGDKSISHRALLLGALAAGRSRVSGLLEAEDVLATAAAVRALGVPIERSAQGIWTVDGGGLGALWEPARPIDCGNAGTLARLVSGILAANPMTVTLCGDASLSARPMERVFEPLRAMGARITARQGDRLPGTLQGTARPLPLDRTLAVPSAQVKSAILLAGLHSPAESRLHEPVKTRDHTERMLCSMGASLRSEPHPRGGVQHALTGGRELAPLQLRVPRDPSSAALIAATALTVEGSEIELPAVCANPGRCGFFDTVREMGADVEFRNPRIEGGEPVADIHVRQAPLRGVRVPAERAPSMIDEYPALAVLAAFADGETCMEGLGELRAKECDRLAAMADGLANCGVHARTGADSLRVRGRGKPPGGAEVQARGDHRVAMAFLALGQGAKADVRIDDGRAIATSFPDFVACLAALGGNVGPCAGSER